MSQGQSSHPRKERTFVMLKPDSIQRGLIGEILSRFERTGLKLVAMKMILATEDQCWKHYNKDDEWFLKKGTVTMNNLKEKGLPVTKEPIEYGKDILRSNIAFMTSGPLIPMVWEGNQAVAIIKKIVGGTEPLTSDVGTIRGDLTMDSYQIANIDGRAVRNLIHCSDQVEEATREMNIWFSKEELVNYRLVQEEILYDVNLDGILE